MLNHLLEQLWQTSWQATAVAVFVLVLRGLFIRTLTPRLRHALWFLVLGRLLIPSLPESRLSLFCLEELLHGQKSPLKFITPPDLDTARTLHVSVHYSIAQPFSVVATPASPPSTSKIWHWPLIIAAIWLIIAMAMISRLVLINLRFARRLWQSLHVTPAHLTTLLNDCRRHMKIARCSKLLITDAVDAPAVSGIFRPCVLLPVGFAESLSETQLRLVFLHELAHIACHDVAIDWMWAILQSLHWFNPAMWIIAPLRRSDRELARDEMVLNIIGPAQARTYGQILLQLAQTAKLPVFCPGLVGIVSGKRRLQRRVEMIAGFNGRRIKSAWAGGVLIAIAGCCAMTNPRTADPGASEPLTNPPRSSTMSLHSTDDEIDRVTPEAAQAEPQSPRTLQNMSGDPGGVEIEARRYHVSDLLFVPTDYELGVEHFTKEKLDALRASRIEDLKTYILNSVGNASWKPEGGGTITMDALNSTLIINQTRTKQHKIQRALDSLRNSRGGQLQIQTRLLVIDEDALKNLPEAIQQRLAKFAGAGRDRTDQILTVDEARTFIAVSQQKDISDPAHSFHEVDSSKDALNAAASTVTIGVPRLTLFDGTKGMLIMSTQQAYVDSISLVTAIKNGNTVTHFQPHVSTLDKFGVALRVSGCPSPDHKSVFVDLHPAFARLLALVPEHWSGAPADVDAKFQRPVTVKYERSISCAIPNHTTLLLGGFTQIISTSLPGHSTLMSDDITPSKVEDVPTTQAFQNAEIERAIERERHKRIYMLVTPTIVTSVDGKTAVDRREH